MWFAEGAAAAAESALWERDEDTALQAVDEALVPLQHEWLMYTAPLYTLGARAHADRVERARALRRDGDVSGAAMAGLAARFDAQLAAFDAGPPPPESVAWRAQFEAERGRLEDDDAPARWQAARERWEALGFAYFAAVCAWREANAIVRGGGDRDDAARLLSAAHTAAAGMGARPLREEIEALARRARLDVSTPGSAARAPAGSAADELGLTARELEVLRLVAAGRTNRQIGTELYMSGKTASVHVSRILAKLGAANRSEAGAIARRLGLEHAEAVGGSD
jgi:DNA-binding CsgD family transcriptional regulator